MRLTEVEVNAYRSLYDVSLAPKALSVLVGPNNAGKTNVVNSLEFLAQVARNGLEIAVSREGGFENLAFRRARRTRRPVRFAFSAELDASELRTRPGGRSPRRPLDRYQISVSYSFELEAWSASRDADFRVTKEDLTISVLGEMTGSVHVQRREGEVVSRAEGYYAGTDERGVPHPVKWLLDPISNGDFVDYLNRTLDSTSLVLNRMAFNVVVAEVLEQLGKTRIYQLTPVECRKTGASTPNPELDRHGGNLPAVVRYVQRNHPDAWSATLRAMRGIVPGLLRIETEFTSGRRLALLFHEDGARAWTSDDVSDGTIQSLALFTSLFDPRVPLALIEEPENSVHPWIVRAFADACREVQGKRILLTTHSPALISYLRPEELDIVWRGENGRTNVCALEKLDPQARALWESGDLDLYDLIDGGWVRESVPPGLQ